MTLKLVFPKRDLEFKKEDVSKFDSEVLKAQIDSTLKSEKVNNMDNLESKCQTLAENLNSEKRRNKKHRQKEAKKVLNECKDETTDDDNENSIPCSNVPTFKRFTRLNLNKLSSNRCFSMSSL